MDYSQFRFKAVVDWIEIEVQITNTTNFFALQRRLNRLLRLPEGKKAHVKAMDEGAGGSATIFRVRIQDPKNWQKIDEILRGLQEYHVFAKKPEVTAIEIAVDAYSKGEATDRDLADLTVSYHRNMTHPVSDNRRVYKDYKGSAESTYIRRPGFINRIEEGYQIGIGNKTDKLYQHGYLKTTDDGKALPKEKHRARIEIRLQGKEIQDGDFENWRSFQFQSLSKFFNFRKLKDGLDPFMQFLSEASSQNGERRLRNTSVGKHLYSPNTEADITLNKKTYEALRGLSDRWRVKVVRVATV